ncbi:MAG: small ribosomal subunit Rsm22 family protein [Methanomicrobiales archaeon]
MSGGEILAALRPLAEEKRTFLASELPDLVARKIRGRNPCLRLEPALSFLALGCEKKGDDLIFSRLPGGKTFVPAPDILAEDDRYLRHPSIPGRLQELVEDHIRKKTGKAWDDPVVLERIRGAIRAQKGEYWNQARGRTISYRAGYRILAYLAYQAPASFIQFQHILHDLAADGLLKDRMRVLDIGSGPGTVPLAVISTWSRLSPGDVRIFALEREEEQLEAYRSLVPGFASPDPSVHVEEPVQGDLKSCDPALLPREVDLLVFGSVLNELRELSVGERAALAERISGVLAEGGTLVITEPADLENSLALRRLSAALTRRGLTLYAPCTPLWSTSCTPDRCWTFGEGPSFVPPRLMTRLAASSDGYRYLNTDVKFSYALHRRDRLTREAYRIPRGMKALRLSKLQGHLKRRVNVVIAKMSGDLGGRGDHVFKVCDGTPQKPVFAVVPRHHAAHARALLEGRYGEILSLESTLVRFNPARDAFNLFVDRSTKVDFLRHGQTGRNRGGDGGRGSPP